MKLVLVEWCDSCSGNGWQEKNKVEHTDWCIAVGVLKDETEKEIEIMPYCSHDLKIHQMSIPKGCIKRMRQLCLH